MVLADPNPTPSFASPHADEATVTFAPVNEAGAVVSGARLFVGDYQARARAVADTDPATTLGNTVQLVPGTYNVLATAAGRGHERVGPVDVTAGATTLTVEMPTNLASSAAGATVSGDGINLARIVDDDEATNWASLGSPVAGKQVTVDLAGGAHRVDRVQVSAMLRPAGDGRSRRGHARPCLGATAVPGARLRGDGRGRLRGRCGLQPGIHEPGGRFPLGRAAASRAGVDPADVRHPGHQGDPLAVGGGDQPVHGCPGVRR